MEQTKSKGKFFRTIWIQQNFLLDRKQNNVVQYEIPNNPDLIAFLVGEKFSDEMMQTQNVLASLRAFWSIRVKKL